MKKVKFKTYVIWVLLTEAIGFIAGLITREATEIYNTTITKPPLSPPPIVFPIVWTILYALMGISAARIYESDKSELRSRGLKLYFIQLFFNFFWSIIFFNFQAFNIAFIWLVILECLIIAMIYTFYKVDKAAGLIQIPYAVWVAFAGYLNLGVFFLNK